MKYKTIIKRVFHFFVYLFATVGLVLIAGFFAVKFKITDVSGGVDTLNPQFQLNNSKLSSLPQEVKGAETTKPDLSLTNINQQIDKLKRIKDVREKNYCQIQIIGQFYPANARRIIEIYDHAKADAIVAKSIMALTLRLKNNADFQSRIAQCDSSVSTPTDYSDLKNEFANADGPNAFSWINKPEWQTIGEAVKKDKGEIDQVGQQADIEPRLIVADMIVEQLRLFYSEREVFKKFFEPLKILCSADKISLGVMGIKEETAIKIENNLKDPASKYYLGPQYEHLLDFKTSDVTSERYDRLADDKNHYYSYLYGALYLKEMMKQWKDAGYGIDWRPEIIGTLFNVGFPQSRPNPDPKVGGSHVNIGGEDYSFGAMSYEFYYSGELLDEFPYQTN